MTYPLDFNRPVLQELQKWQEEMQRGPGLLDSVGTGIQKRVNQLLPESFHSAVTAAFKVVTRFLLSGSDLLTSQPLKDVSFQSREEKVEKAIDRYKMAATAEGAITGAGGILLGLADLPLWLSIKIKMLTHIAALYGYDTSDVRERIFLLHVLSLTFSSPAHRNKVYKLLVNWEAYAATLPNEAESFNWRNFQQEYRDYLDIAKLLQLVPGIGAAVGAVVNSRMTQRLGRTAMNAYRMRLKSAAGNIDLPAKL